MSDVMLIVQKMVDVGWHLSMDTDDLNLLVRKLIVISLRYVRKEELWDGLFSTSERSHVDWSLLKEGFNALGEVFFWLPVLERCGWGECFEKKSNAPLRFMKQCLRRAGLDTANHDLACRLMLLHLLEGIPVLYAFEMLLCRHYSRNMHAGSAILLANLSDKLYTPEEYSEAVTEIVQGMQVDVEDFEKMVRVLEDQRKMSKEAALKQVEYLISSGRPRLRDLVQQSTQQKLALDVRLGTWETYTAFCQLHQFPNIMNDVTKQKLYFLASQTRWEWQGYVNRVVGHHGEVGAKVGAYPVSRPDPPVIHSVIQRLSVNGRAPFGGLLEFKKRCFINFPVCQFTAMNLTQFLRLYVCIYQSEGLWKELWRMQGALFSPQVMKDCEAFVASRPFASEDFFSFFCG